MPKIKGIDFDFGDEVLTIPPLSLGALELLQDRLATVVMGSTDPKSVGTVIDRLCPRHRGPSVWSHRERSLPERGFEHWRFEY